MTRTAALALAALLLLAAPAAAEVGIVPGSSPAIPSERFAWCGRIPMGPIAGYVPKPMIADLEAAGGDWVAAKIAAGAPYGIPGYIPTAGVVGAEARGVLKGHVDELCRLGLLGPWQAPGGGWNCAASTRETEILGGLPGGCAGVNPVRKLWMDLIGPAVPARAVSVSYPYEPCGLHQTKSVLFRDVEWRVNAHALCGQSRPAAPLVPPYGAAPVPQAIIEDPSAERLTKLPEIWPPAACWYDSRSGFGSGVRLWLDSPGCRGEVPPVDPPDPPVDPPIEPPAPPVEPPPPAECDLGPVLLELEAIRAEIQALRSALAGLAATADSLRARQQEIDRRAEVRCKALATSAAQRAACEVR